MSDYVENQEYSMQLAAPGDDPFNYDWTRLQEEVDGVTSSLFDDVTPASLQEDIDVDDNEWAKTNDAFKNGPWRDIFDWTFDSQDLETQPGDRALMSANPPSQFGRTGKHLQRLHTHVNLDRTELMPDDNTSHSGTSADIKPNLVCDHPRCGSKVFKRNGDITRHKKLHEQERDFPCKAQECKFSFTRNDKPIDHIRAGHDAEALFACPRCSMLLTRDILPLHPVTHTGKDYASLNLCRQCPLPRCNFRARISGSGLDSLRDHLLKDHDPKGRRMYAPLLASRGYDHESANIVCPICTAGTAFNEHKEFGFHFLEMHLPNLSANDSNPRCNLGINRALENGAIQLWFYGLQKWGVITDEQRKHRHTILSLLPMFGSHPVWGDIKYCC